MMHFGGRRGHPPQFVLTIPPRLDDLGGTNRGPPGTWHIQYTPGPVRAHRPTGEFGITQVANLAGAQDLGELTGPCGPQPATYDEHATQ